MDKLLKFVKDNKIFMLLSWLVFVCAIYIFLRKVIFSQLVTGLQLVFVCIISLIVYLAIVFTTEYVISNRKLKWVNSIYSEFAHMQIFLDHNDVIIEVLEAEEEKLKQLGAVREFKIERFSEHNGVIKLIVR